MPCRRSNRIRSFELFSVVLALVVSGVGAPGHAFGADGTRPTNPVVVPFQLRRGHIMLPVRVTNSAPMSLMLDTGYAMTMLHPELIATFGLRRTGRVTIVGIAGEAPAEVYEGPELDFSGVTWKPRRVAAFTDGGGGGRSRRRDGIIGSGFFRRFVVEIDSRHREVRLHEPGTFQYTGSGEVLPLTFSGDTPVVEATLRVSGETDVKGRFEVDTGCDSSLCLGKHFVEAHHLAPTNSTGGGKAFGVGGSTSTHMTHLPRIQLGQLTVARPEVYLFLEGSPVDPPYAGHIGWELLQRFRVIFDYPGKKLILERVPE
jgi:predicted aspartyl protease